MGDSLFFGARTSHNLNFFMPKRKLPDAQEGTHEAFWKHSDGEEVEKFRPGQVFHILDKMAWRYYEFHGGGFPVAAQGEDALLYETDPFDVGPYHRWYRIRYAVEDIVPKKTSRGIVRVRRVEIVEEVSLAHLMTPHDGKFRLADDKGGRLFLCTTDSQGNLHSHDGRPSVVGKDLFQWHTHGKLGHPLVSYYPSSYYVRGSFGWLMDGHMSFGWCPTKKNTAEEFDMCPLISMSLCAEMNAIGIIKQWRSSTSFKQLRKHGISNLSPDMFATK